MSITSLRTREHLFVYIITINAFNGELEPINLIKQVFIVVYSPKI